MAVAVLALLLAGCAGPDGAEPLGDAGDDVADGGPDAGDAAGGPPAAGASALGASSSECRQWHEVYLLPREGFVEMMPPGFVPAPLDETDELTVVLITVMVCAQANNTLGEDGSLALVLAKVAVVPPPEFRNASVDSDWLALGGFVAAGPLHGFFVAADLTPGILPGSVAVTHPLGQEDVSVIVARAGGIEWEIRSTLRAQPGVFAGSVQRVWGVAEGGTLSAVALEHSDCVQIGSGGSVFRGQGDADAPPAYVGLSHSVAGCRVLWDHWTPDVA